MNTTLIWGVVLVLAVAVDAPAAEVAASGAGGEAAAATAVLRTQRERSSYGIGVEIARNFKRQKFDVDAELVARGMKDALAGNELLLSDDELLATLNYFGTEMTRKRAREKLVNEIDNRKTGEAFLAENRKKEGVVTLPSGVQYRILKAGAGKKPSDTDMVACQYRATLVDGTEFDTTRLAGQPARFSLSDSKVVPGLREALRLMPAGSRWQIVVPHQLAYGQQGSGREVGPNATLIYEVELLAVEPSAASSS